MSTLKIEKEENHRIRDISRTFLARESVLVQSSRDMTAVRFDP
jgi:hypothetical protein